MRVTIFTSTSNNNLKLAENLKSLLEEKQTEVELFDLEQEVLPLYSPSAEKDGIPELAQKFTKSLSESKGIILVAPEYNGSIPPNVSNMIAWVSRSGDDWRAAFNGKFAIVATHSGGGGLKVVDAMRRQLEHIGSTVLARSIVTNYSRPAKDESLHAILDQFVSYIKI